MLLIRDNLPRVHTRQALGQALSKSSDPEVLCALATLVKGYDAQHHAHSVPTRLRSRSAGCCE